MKKVRKLLKRLGLEKLEWMVVQFYIVFMAALEDSIKHEQTVKILSSWAAIFCECMFLSVCWCKYLDTKYLSRYIKYFADQKTPDGDHA